MRSAKEISAAFPLIKRILYRQNFLSEITHQLQRETIELAIATAQDHLVQMASIMSDEYIELSSWH